MPSPAKTVFSSQPYLLLDNQGQSLTLELTQGEHRVGRDPQRADLRVPPDWLVMSGCQALIRRQGNDYLIYDGDGQRPSSNGLFLNHHRLTPQTGHRLRPGDTLRVGQNPQNWVLMTFDDGQGSAALPPVQKAIELRGQTVTLGRDPHCDLVLAAPTISRTHGILVPQGGNYVLQDRSTNGIFLNGQRISGSAILPPGGKIRLGPYTLVRQGDRLVIADQGESIRLDAQGLVRTVPDRKTGRPLRLLQEISLPIEPGQFVALVGGSGAGKSTLMRALLGIEPTNQGMVYLNGEPLRDFFNLYRHQIGYVPQSDIVHLDLRVRQVLTFAAQLRLPADADVTQVVDRTLDQIEMTERQDVPVRALSGGQLKRVSIGVELLSDPKLFFLDEPTSGLDPGLDKKMMQLLRRLADEGRTIILVTHATTNITLCDRLVFMGRGGHLCYYGPPQEAGPFFGLTSGDFADIYIHLEQGNQVEQSSQRFLNSSEYRRYVGDRLSITPQTQPQPKPQQVKPNPLRQWGILAQRYGQLMIGDRLNLALNLLTAPIGIAFITLAIRDQDPLVIPTEGDPSLAPLALRVLFVFTCAALWVGLSSSLQEIVKEGAIYLRERLVNLSLIAYIGSKLTILGAVALAQTLLMAGAIALGFADPAPDLLPWLPGVAITTFLTLFACLNLGLAVSASVKNSSQANSALPLLLLPQIIFSGVLFKMEGAGKYLSWVMLSRWSVGAYGSLVNVNAMVPEAQVLPDGSTIPLPFEATPVYDPTWSNLLLNWGILLLHGAIYLAIACFLQKRKDLI